MIKEVRIISTGNDTFKEGYFLSIEQIAKLCRNFQADCFDGFVSNDESYLELQLKNMEE